VFAGREVGTLRSMFTTPSALVGVVVLATVVVCAIFADVISPVDPAQQHLLYRLSPPGTVSEDGVTFVLGTDGLGRDVLSGIIHGSRVSLIVAVTAVGLGMLIGVALGLVSGYSGGWLDTVIMRAVDVTIVLPFMLMALVLRLALGPGLGSIVIALGISGWATHARLVRGEVLSLRNKEYVLASVANGAPHGFIMLRRILPHVLASAIVLASLQVGVTIVAEASLTFLGLGVPPEIPSWGQMLANGRDYMTRAWWVTTFSGLAIVLTVLALNLIGDWLRDYRDPRLER
jgi:peptide/nickel transport system permease protein